MKQINHKIEDEKDGDSYVYDNYASLPLKGYKRIRFFNANKIYIEFNPEEGIIEVKKRPKIVFKTKGRK